MREFLVCIDSDGCAIDSMECKHRHCFGPYIIDVWNLEQWKEEILNRWNEINLYSLTRGINRFLGLEKMLTEISMQFCKIDGLNHYSRWCRDTDTFSNASLQKEIDSGAHPIFDKVMEWSNRVNQGIVEISYMIKPFEGVTKALERMHGNVDIAIVSSANPQAVHEEWNRFGLMEQVDYVMAQDAGTKTDCISKLLAKGYFKNHVMMIGDALGDQQAAEKNGVLYYPILAGQETSSWKQWIEEAYIKFCEESYCSEYQQEQLIRFKENLS